LFGDFDHNIENYEKAANSLPPTGPVQDMADIFGDPHVEARQMLETCDPGSDNPDITLAANPIKFSETRTVLQPSVNGDNRKRWRSYKEGRSSTMSAIARSWTFLLCRHHSRSSCATLSDPDTPLAPTRPDSPFMASPADSSPKTR